jgi:predicted enzyme related to lactoylglutathione lyase
MDSLDDYFEYALDLTEPDRQRLLSSLRASEPATAERLQAMLAEWLHNPDFACRGMPLAATPAEPAAVLALMLPVADVAAAVRWYQDVFRVRLIRQDQNGAVVAFANLELHLQAAGSASIATASSITVAMADASRLGGSSRQPDGSRQLQLVDPFGHVFHVTDRQVGPAAG